MDLDIEISPMQAADVKAVEAIEQESFSSPWTRDCFESLLLEENACALAARAGERLAGYVICFGTDEGFVVANLAVSASFRGRGLGRRLLEAALAEGRESGARWALLDVRESNQVAIRLYLSAGFLPVGRRPGYYSQPDEDSIVMALKIG